MLDVAPFAGPLPPTFTPASPAGPPEPDAVTEPPRATADVPPTDPAQPLAGASSSRCLRGFWGGYLDDFTDTMSWLWDGYLAPGLVTLLTAQWKSGKTTLLS